MARLRRQIVKGRTYYSLIEVTKDKDGKRHQRTLANYGRRAPIFYPPKIMHGDCMAKLDLLPSACVQLCLTDPPYYLETKHGIGENWDSFASRQAFKEFTEGWLAKVDRVLDEGGVFIGFFCSYKITYLYEYLANKDYKCLGTFTWHKTNGQCYNAARRMRGSTEIAIVMAKKGRHYTYNSRGKAISNILSFPTLQGAAREKAGWHPTEKPVPLIAHLLQLYSNEGDVVLDPFGGKGATAIACLAYTRKCVMVELGDYYYQCITRRIADWRLTNKHQTAHTWKIKGMLCD